MAYNLLPLFFLLGFLSTSPSPSSAAEPACNPSDKLALLRFKRSLGDPYTLISWTNDTDCCRSWYCTECDDAGRVTAIVISYMELSNPAPLPPSVGDLPFLQKLIVRKSPNITGPLPQQLSKLKNLQMLWMDWNTLTGSVPSIISKLTKLTYINLSFNKLSGSIPPSIGYLPLLEALFLDRNQLTGTIPEELGRLRQLDLYIRLSHNNLTGSIPKSFSSLNITQIDLSRNKLSGDASVLFPSSGIWTQMNLSRNLFEFDISKAELLGDAYTLDLSHNRIYGKIPKKLDQLENLGFFDVSYNRLCGPIPQGGFLSNRTQDAYLHNRCLCGNPLPKCKIMDYPWEIFIRKNCLREEYSKGIFSIEGPSFDGVKGWR